MSTKIFIGIMVVVGGIYFLANHSGGPKELVEVHQNSFHIVLGLDPSGTTKGNGWPWPSKPFFELQIQFLEQNGGGVLEVYNFSNPIPQPIRLKIQPLKILPDVYEGESEVKKAEQHNQFISTQNQISKEQFWKKMEEVVLNYQPTKGNDFTYVFQNCAAIRQSLSLPQYANYSQYVLLYSDLINDEPNKKPQLISEEIIRQISSMAQLIICNYSTQNEYEQFGVIQLPDYNEFNGLVQSNKSLTSKN